MASLSDIGLAAAINILSAFAFLLAFAILRIQPINDRVYFPKWYLKGLRSSPLQAGLFVSKFVNLDFKSYIRFLSWMPAALQMPEPELIDHAGLDSAVYLRIYLLGYALINHSLWHLWMSTIHYFLAFLSGFSFTSNGSLFSEFSQFFAHCLCLLIFYQLGLLKCRLKIFVPIAFLAFSVMVPVNWTNSTLERSNLTYSEIDKLSISNIPTGSNRYANFSTCRIVCFIFYLSLAFYIFSHLK